MSAQRIAVNAEDVERVLADYLAAPDPQAEVQEIARRCWALPFWRDFGGCLFLRPDGTIWSMGWDNPGDIEPVGDSPHDRAIVHAARGIASRHFPAIAGLAPARGPAAIPCTTCDGSGFIPNVSDKHPDIVCSCGGLGWLPEPPCDNRSTD